LWAENDEWCTAIAYQFDPIWGDRRQEIVFIGCDPMNEHYLTRCPDNGLDNCLVEETQFTPQKWHDLRDSSPHWR